MCTRLCCYLSIIFLILVSSSSFALTPQEQAFGGFAFPTVCSHPTDINFCVKMEDSEPEKTACLMWMSYMQAGQTGPNSRQYSFRAVMGKSCEYAYTVISSGFKGNSSQPLSYRTGLCPVQDAPPPENIIFSRSGRWYAGEAAGTRCFKTCEYRTSASTFSVKYYTFTNGVVTQFTETSNRAKSNAKFCFAEPEPVRAEDGEITTDASCDQKLFAVFCDFIKWYRTDSEMPTSPEIENKTLQIDTSLKTNHVDANPFSTADFNCFKPITFSMYLPFASKEVKQEITFDLMCNKLREISFFFHTLYLLHAAFIIFRK